ALAAASSRFLASSATCATVASSRAGAAVAVASSLVSASKLARAVFASLLTAVASSNASLTLGRLSSTGGGGAAASLGGGWSNRASCPDAFDRTIGSPSPTSGLYSLIAWSLSWGTTSSIASTPARRTSWSGSTT